MILESIGRRDDRDAAEHLVVDEDRRGDDAHPRDLLVPIVRVRPVPDRRQFFTQVLGVGDRSLGHRFEVAGEYLVAAVGRQVREDGLPGCMRVDRRRHPRIQPESEGLIAHRVMERHRVTVLLDAHVDDLSRLVRETLDLGFRDVEQAAPVFETPTHGQKPVAHAVRPALVDRVARVRQGPKVSVDGPLRDVESLRDLRRAGTVQVPEEFEDLQRPFDRR